MVEKQTYRRRQDHPGTHAGGSCVKVEDMTVDDLRNIAVSTHLEGSCPICGRFHLTRRELSLLDILLTLNGWQNLIYNYFKRFIGLSARN